MAPRAHATNVALSIPVGIGAQTITVRVMPTEKAKSKKTYGKVSNLCPTCHASGKQSAAGRGNICKENPKHGPFLDGEVAKLVEYDGQERTFSANEFKEADNSRDTDKVIDLRAVPADQVEAATSPSGRVFVLDYDDLAGDSDPARAKQAFFSCISNIVDENGVMVHGKQRFMLVGWANTKTTEFVRLTMYRGKIAIEGLRFAADLLEIEPPAYTKVPAATRKAMAEAIASTVEEFDRDALSDPKLDRPARLLAATTDVAEETDEPSASEADLIAGMLKGAA